MRSVRQRSLQRRTICFLLILRAKVVRMNLVGTFSPAGHSEVLRAGGDRQADPDFLGPCRALLMKLADGKRFGSSANRADTGHVVAEKRQQPIA